MALLLAVFTLPSALNLPQANPGQTLEYAPVPGENGNTSGGGNFAGLGLGSGAAPGEGGTARGNQAPGLSALLGQEIPSVFQCVGNPPRQTEDPLSPPCVAAFSGDNGGVTYPGVSVGEITTVFAYDGCAQGSSCTGAGPTSQGFEQTPPPGYYDLEQPPDSRPNQNMIYFRELRLWQNYFNARYQTYKRRVHFWIYITDATATPDGRRAQAADTLASRHPFAVFNQLTDANSGVYTEALAQHGVLNFGSFWLRAASTFSSYPKQIWSYLPSSDQLALMYSSFVCQKMKPYPTSFSGNPGENGSPRKFANIYTNDPGYPELASYDAAVERGTSACGIDFGPDRLGQVYAEPQSEQDATVAIARFKSDHVTTILISDNLVAPMEAAAADQYFPEWVIVPNGYTDGDANAQLYNQQEMANAWTVTPQALDGRDGVNASCDDAVRSEDPTINSVDMVWYCARYDDIRQYFTGIQVAGPMLSPNSIDQGFRAIPPHNSSSPQVPACYYDPGDFTCVKDAMAEWWDPRAANAESTSTGCWRAIRSATRYRAGLWPAGDPKPEENSSSDPCNTYASDTP